MMRRNHTVLIIVDVQGNLAQLIDNKDIVSLLSGIIRE